MRYSTEPRDIYVIYVKALWIYVKGYGFLSFAINMGKNLSNEYVSKHSVSKKSTKKLQNNETEVDILKKRYISQKERQQIIDELKLV